MLDHHAREFQTLVTNIQLPGAKGWDVARRARELHPKIGVVYVSGDSGQGWHEGSGLPGSLFLQKPYSNGDLVLAISKAS